MSRICVAVVLVLLAVPAGAQELTLFDLNDFLDPRDLGAVPTSRGSFTCPCADSLISRAMVGWDHDFVNVMQPTSLDVAFAHVATSYYRAPFQFNVKTTAVREVHRPEVAFVGRLSVPRESLTLQLAHYRASGNSANALVRRMQVTWRIAHYTQPGLDRGTQERIERDLIHHEFGAEFDLQLFRKFLGSLSFTAIAGEHPDAESLTELSRLAYVQRFPAFELGRVRFEPTITAGVLGRQLDFGGLNAIALQPSIRAALPIGSKGAHLNARFAPTFQRHAVRTGREGPVVLDWLERYELAIFFDAPIFTKTWLREPRQSRDE